MVLLKSRNVIILIILVILVASYLIYNLISKDLISSVDFFTSESEVRKMQEILYDIDRLVLFDKDNSLQEHEMDISKFKELIPYAKYDWFVLTKGTRLEGIATMSDGRNVKVSFAEMYAVFQFDIREDNFLFYYFDDNELKKKWFTLLEKTIGRKLDSFSE